MTQENKICQIKRKVLPSVPKYLSLPPPRTSCECELARTKLARTNYKFSPVKKKQNVAFKQKYSHAQNKGYFFYWQTDYNVKDICESNSFVRSVNNMVRLSRTGLLLAFAMSSCLLLISNTHGSPRIQVARFGTTMGPNPVFPQGIYINLN